MDDLDAISTDSNNSILVAESNGLKTTIMLKNIDRFYSEPDNLKMLKEYVVEKKISLRIIDWFVTNYSKKYNIVINDSFIVFLEYKSQLKAYTKKIFDPFCRRERIIRCYNNEKINTTLGQLNFFKWAIENNLLDYIDKNTEAIERDMNVKEGHNSHIKLNKNNICATISFD